MRSKVSAERERIVTAEICVPANGGIRISRDYFRVNILFLRQLQLKLFQVSFVI